MQDCRPGHHAYGATGADKYLSPCARNTLIVAKYREDSACESTKLFGGDAVCYGQKICLLAHSGAQDLPVDAAGGPNPLYLFSKPVSTTHYSKYSHEQVCGFTNDPSFDTVFQVGSALSSPATDSC